VDANQLSIAGTQAYEVEVGRLRQLAWQERKPRLLPGLTLGEWDGSCEIALRDGGTRKVRYRVVYWRGYPWRKPTVWPTDPRHDRTLHLSAPSTDDERDYAEAAGLGHRLCIWDDYVGWDPELAEQEIPARIHGWFDRAENGWPGSEGQILDPERYFINGGSLLLAPDGLWGLKRQFGTVRVAADQRVGVIEYVGRAPCPGYRAAAAALRLTPALRPTVPYVLLPCQPATPIFDTLGGLRDEAIRQGLDGRKLVHHLRTYVVRVAPARRRRTGKSKKDRRHGRKKNRWPQTQTLSPPHWPGGTDMSLRFLLAYPVNDQRIGCQLILPRLKSEPAGTAASKQYRIEASLDQKLLSGAVRSLDSRSLLKRNPRRMNSGTLTEASVMLLGLGSIGSMLAELLVKAGVNRIVLADADVLEPGNVIRHASGIEGTGKPKAIAVRDRLTSIRHDGTYEIIHDATGQEMARCDIIQHLDRIADRAAGCALVLDCTGSEAVLQAVSKICRAKPVPFLSVGTYYAAAVGQVLAAIPGQPCLECLRKALGDRPDIDVPVLKEDETVAAEGCAAVTSPASAADLATTCSLAAQAAIDVLVEKGLNWHQRLWIGRPLQDAPESSVFLDAPQVVDSLIDAARCDLCRD